MPVLPGYRGEDQSDARLLQEAQALGVPLLVKASAGGGGRGMRLVTDLADAPEAITSARGEAKGSFGDAAVFLERYAPRARHVEVQVLGDSHGNVLHLGDRDCSLQRNHQKLIEEAPAADLPEAVRDDMRAAAVRLAQSIGYRSAGTVEYLYDPARGEYYFLEMNTRLQVEHPVTEAITGIDLVEWQLRIARGEALSLAQSDVHFSGHAIEVRIAAENPAENFRPETGQITLWVPPAGVRLDSGVVAGSVIGHHYDSMIAKLIVHAPDRAGAIRQAVAAIDTFAVGGVGLNLSYQRALLNHPDFQPSGITPRAFPNCSRMAGRNRPRRLRTWPSLRWRCICISPHQRARRLGRALVHGGLRLLRGDPARHPIGTHPRTSPIRVAGVGAAAATLSDGQSITAEAVALTGTA